NAEKLNFHCSQNLDGALMDSDDQARRFRSASLAVGYWAVMGAAIPGGLAVGYSLYRWWDPDPAPSTHFHHFMSELVEYWRLPVFGCAVFSASAAWATYAPPGSWRFSRSLLAIFAISVACWILVAWIDDLLGLRLFRQSRGEDPNDLR